MAKLYGSDTHTQCGFVLFGFRRKGVAKLDGSDPMLLNGYGAYEISNDPVSDLPGGQLVVSI